MQSMVFIVHPRWLAAKTLKVLAASQRGRKINAIDCIYSKLPSDDEYLIYLKHVKE